MADRRCDLCGPYTPEQAAAFLLGTWKAERTDHLCEPCRAGVKVAAQELADRIDAAAAEKAYRG